MPNICEITINNEFEQKIRADDIINTTNTDDMIDRTKHVLKNNMIDMIETIFYILTLVITGHEEKRSQSLMLVWRDPAIVVDVT